MKTPKRLLQLLVAAVIAAAPAVAQAQSYPFPPSYGPYGPAFGPVVTPFPALSSLFGGALADTPLDPSATTVQVVPPTGGTVMLYRGSAMRGWWMQPGLVTVQPDVVYSLVATRGTRVLYASGIVFRPGYTTVAWSGDALPAIAYQPAWYPGGYGEGRMAARPHAHGSSARHAAAPAATGADGYHRARPAVTAPAEPTAERPRKLTRSAGGPDVVRKARKVGSTVDRRAAQALHVDPALSEAATAPKKLVAPKTATAEPAERKAPVRRLQSRATPQRALR